MSWAAVGGAAIGVAGSVMSGNKQADANAAAAEAARFKPYTVNGFGGQQARFNEKHQRLDLEGGLQENIFQNFAQEALMRNQGGGTEATLGGQLTGSGAGLLPSAFADAGSFQGRTPEQAQLLEQMFGQQGAVQGQFGQQGLQAAFSGAGSSQSLAQDMAQRGQGLLDGGNFNALAAQRLTALREGARPTEDRAVDSKLGNLFSSGRLGTTGGSRAMGELGMQMELADQNRITQSQNFAQQQSNYERQLGASLTGQAFSGFGQEAQRLNAQGQLGANLMQGQGRSTSAQLGAVQVGDQAGASRVDRRLSNAQNMFGFGQDVEQGEFSKTMQLIGGQQAIQGGIMDLAKLGGSVGQMQAAAGSNVGQFLQQGGHSTTGAALQGLGAGISNSGVDFGTLFSGSGTGGSTSSNSDIDFMAGGNF